MFEIKKLKSYSGIIELPGDKSISHRALMIGSLASGKSTFKNLSTSQDVNSTKICLESLGIKFRQHNDFIEVNGNSLNGFKQSNSLLDVGNSGTTIRLLSGILSGQKFMTTITGDESIQKRPMKRIIEPLSLMNASIKSKNGFAPLEINPVSNLIGIEYELPIASAQIKSSVLFAGLYAEGKTTIVENLLTRNHTENMIGLKTNFNNNKYYTSISKEFEIIPFEDFLIPSDPSTAAFLVALTLLSDNSEVRIPNISLNPTRCYFVDLLINLGANIKKENIVESKGELVGDLVVKSSVINGDLNLNKVDIPKIIDEIPILAVLSLFKKGKFKISDSKELRVKESDRINAICENIKNIGIEVNEYEDGFEFEANGIFKPTNFLSFNDHRIAMAFTIAGMKIENCTIDNKDVVNISFPAFWDLIKLFS